MKKEILYTYLGTNGTICSPVHLEDVYYVRKVRLRAEGNKKLTKDFIKYYSTVTVAEQDVDNWFEIEVE